MILADHCKTSTFFFEVLTSKPNLSASPSSEVNNSKWKEEKGSTLSKMSPLTTVP
jgi:hypothetical protein